MDSNMVRSSKEKYWQKILKWDEFLIFSDSKHRKRILEQHDNPWFELCGK
jgi:hypothetical protein